MEKNKKLISFVLPVYNEEKNIFPLYKELQRTMEGIDKEYNYEIIFIDDGSQDESWTIIA